MQVYKTDNNTFLFLNQNDFKIKEYACSQFQTYNVPQFIGTKNSNRKIKK